MSEQVLTVGLHGEAVAELRQGEGGLLSLRYLPQATKALSLGLPLQGEAHGHQAFGGLLPESEAARLAERWAVWRRTHTLTLPHPVQEHRPRRMPPKVLRFPFGNIASTCWPRIPKMSRTGHMPSAPLGQEGALALADAFPVDSSEALARVRQ